ncbi:polyprenyl synthetase family protein [Sulfurospirillum multivorans]|uniref:Short chain isoprenyl diphosphate synthase n=2 Tax=Sulfurospirillum multivorans TaxID=66821 RepID=A0AA86AP19_SULMK|nr:polyprenyl synthetase family protein [Sulfurospirillum multivorans]AHJ13162.1 short chain isoprenyl diphosphate synthase [Sulfurospirillum multivorans DSM 12446]QEH06650.1 short chain isoprenyl diphosphate synthase [Sulfurospirillum multivorans]
MLGKVENLMVEMVTSLGDPRSVELFHRVPKGKRLRAKLILKIAGLSEDSLKLAAIVELIHAASLLHDDVIDDAFTRRGEESINALFGNKTAIMLGDILYSKGFSELTFLPKDVAYSIANAVALLSVGELLDVELSQTFNESEERYFDMIYKKTASLIEASAKAAALLAGKNGDIYALYGKNLGLAFQIIDDILDITQSSETLGKPSLNDFKEGKTTLPYLYMYRALNAEDQTKLLSFFQQELGEADKVWIKTKMHETKALEDSITYARKLGMEALDVIENEEDVGLSSIIKEMIERNF